MADPDWRGGDYARQGVRPEKGLAVARMAAHITYLSEAALQRKFGRELQRDGLSWGFDADFQVESYLRHQGAAFVDRFDANSYLYITRALDYFDLAGQPRRRAGRGVPPARATCASACSRSPPTGSIRPPRAATIVRALNAAGARASFVEIETDKGHDAFLLDEPVLHAALRGFLDSGRPGAGPGVSGDAARTSARSCGWCGPARGCSTSAAARASCWSCWRARRASTAAAWRSARQGVSACLARGLAVVQGDADRDLDYFPTRAFDYAVLSQTLQQVREPRHVLSELLRIAERAIVSLPNFGHWRVRLDAADARAACR